MRAREAPVRPFSVLKRNPGFARIYIAQLVSFGGDWFNMVAIAGSILSLSHNAFLVTLLFAVHMLPTALLSTFAGAIVDRRDRRAVMITADVVRAVVALTPLLIHSKGTLWIAFVSQTAISSLTAFFDPASSAALPNLVREEDLTAANAMMGASWGVMLAVGAAIGGVVAATLGRSAAFIGNSISYVVSAALIATVHLRFHAAQLPRHHDTSIATDLKELVRFARAEPKISSLLFVKAGFGLTAGVIGLIAVMAVDVFHRGDTGTGILMGARGVGALIGPFLFKRLFGSHDRGLFTGITIAFIVFGCGYILIGLAPTLESAAIGAAIAHVGGGAQWILSTIGLQRFSPDRIRGRVFGADYALQSFTMGISFLLAGVFANHIGARATIIWFSSAAIVWSLGWTALTKPRWPATEKVLA